MYFVQISFLLRFSWMHWWKPSWGRTLPQQTKFENYQNLITLPEQIVFHYCRISWFSIDNVFFLQSYQQLFLLLPTLCQCKNKGLHFLKCGTNHNFWRKTHCSRCVLILLLSMSIWKDGLSNSSFLSSLLKSLHNLCIVSNSSRFRVPR